jgi:hypothetical protein
MTDVHKPYYPEHPGYVKGSDTSKAAARSVDNPSRSKKLARTKMLLRLAGRSGLTSDELEVTTGWPHQTASALLRKMVLTGEAVDTDMRRRTRYGRMAAVRVLPEFR